jgi:hypothetical protein
MVRWWWWGVAAGCTAPPEAKEDLDNLSRFLYAEQERASDAVLADALLALGDMLAAVPDLRGAADTRSWTLDRLTEDDVGDLPSRPDRDPGLAPGVGVAYQSVWPIEDHARVQTEADQRPFEESAPDHYNRAFPEDEDPTCFLAETPSDPCRVLETFNDATRKNILMEVTFELRKDIRWVPLGDDRRAMLSRSWYERSWPGKKDNVMVWQSYSIDTWIEQDSGETVRFQTLWSESDVGIDISDSAVVATVKSGINALFQNLDDAIGAVYHDGAEAP